MAGFAALVLALTGTSSSEELSSEELSSSDVAEDEDGGGLTGGCAMAGDRMEREGASER